MRVVNKRYECGTVNIMRPSRLGNPYRIGVYGTREEVVEKFRRYALRTPRVLQLIYNLPKDAVLECCCKPLACHGDVIVELALLRPK